jgi:predicted Zn-dependent peptidase
MITLNNKNIRYEYITTSDKIGLVKLMVNFGFKHEDQNHIETAHIMEHLMFTIKKTAQADFLKDIYNHGGKINATTFYDYTEFYIEIPVKYIPKAIELLGKMVCRTIDSLGNLNKEKKIVKQERAQKVKDPGNKIYINAIENLFDLKVFGSDKTNNNINPQIVANYFNKYYIPSNMYLGIIGGKYSQKKIKSIVDKNFEKCFNNSKTKTTKITKTEEILLKRNSNPKKVINPYKKENHGVLLYGYGYPENTKESLEIEFIDFYLSGGFDGVLYKSLRDKYNYIYSISFEQKNYLDDGAWFLRFNCDKKNIRKCIKLIEKELNKIQKISPKVFTEYKKKFLISQEFLADNNDFIITNTIWDKLMKNRKWSFDKRIRNIKKIKREDIIKLTRKIFNKKNIYYII